MIEVVKYTKLGIVETASRKVERAQGIVWADELKYRNKVI